MKKMKAEQEKKIDELIIRSLKEVYTNDGYLISNEPCADSENHVGERAIVFRFAHYLQNVLDNDDFFKNYNLDCEYNRNGRHQKYLQAMGSYTYPDVILHKRGSNKYNLMVIEFKGYWNSDQTNDEKKICGFTSKHDVYRFAVGYTILIGRRFEEVEIKKFKRGEQVLS